MSGVAGAGLATKAMGPGSEATLPALGSPTLLSFGSARTPGPGARVAGRSSCSGNLEAGVPILGFVGFFTPHEFQRGPADYSFAASFATLMNFS